MPPTIRRFCVLLGLLSAISITPHNLRAGGTPVVPCKGRTICVPSLGIAVTLPQSWSATLTSYGLTVAPAANQKHVAAGRLLIALS
jgi:hypothetical protein